MLIFSYSPDGFVCNISKVNYLGKPKKINKYTHLKLHTYITVWNAFMSVKGEEEKLNITSSLLLVGHAVKYSNKFWSDIERDFQW